jgi:4-carboxymuconolactone decarboxylase
MNTWAQDELSKIAESDDQRAHRRGIPEEIQEQPLSRPDDRGRRAQRDRQDHAARDANPKGGETAMSNEKPQSAVRKSLGEFAPKLVDLTEDVLFGDVWERPQLSKRDRSLITCAALVATGKTEQMDFHLPNAIKNGVPQEEIVEMITHLGFYVGWPNAMSAMNRAKALFEKKGGT